MSQTPNRAARRAAAKSKNSAESSMSKPLPSPISAQISKPSEEDSTDTSEITTASLPFPPNLPQMSGIGISDTSEPTDSAKPKKQDRFGKMQDDLFQQFGGLGMIVYTVNPADGQVLLERAEPLAQKLTAVAKQNPQVYKVIKRLLEGSAYSALILELGYIGQAIMKNHGIDPLARLLKRGQAEETSENRFVSGFPQSVPA